VPVMVCTTPSFQVYISWAVISVTIALTVLAGLSVSCGTKSYESLNNKWKIFWWVSATVILFFALATTQCNPMFFWVFVVILLFRPSGIVDDYPNRFIWYFSIFSSSCAVDFAVAEVGKTVYGIHAIAKERTHLTHHFAKKIVWFVNEPLTYALNFWHLRPSSGLAFGMGILILFGLSLYLLRRMGAILLALIILPLSFLPSLAIAESWASYRTTAALSALVIFLGLFTFHGFRQTILHGRYEKLFVIAIAMLTGVSCATAFYNVLQYFAIPQAVELRLLKLVSSKANHQKILSDWEQITFCHLHRYDEFGCSSISQPGVRNHMLDIINEEK